MTTDDDLKATLRALDATDDDARLGEARREALRARIMSSAVRAVAARHRRTMWDYSSRWARAAVPVGLAASILAAALLLRAPAASRAGDASVETTVAYDGRDAASVIHDMASGQIGSAEMLDSLVGPATRDGLYSRLLRGAQ